MAPCKLGVTVVVLFSYLLSGLSGAAESRGASEATPTETKTPASFDCPVTDSHGETFGNDALKTGLWPGGKVVFQPGGPGFILSDGALAMKWGWTRLLAGRLTIEGRRLDGAGAPLRARIPDGYGDTGFQSTALIFPTPGCWEVIGRVGSASLTFVTLVEKIGDGPSSRGDW